MEKITGFKSIIINITISLVVIFIAVCCLAILIELITNGAKI